MPYTQNGRHAMLAGGLTNAIARVGVGNAIPDDTGSGEITGLRQSVTWNAPAGSAADNAAQIQHTIPAGETAVVLQFWNDTVTGGTFYGWAPVNGGTVGYGTVDSAGVTADAIQSAGHGLSNGNRVFVRSVIAESLPAGLTQNTLYYVVGATTNTFQVSTTEGGSAVNITGQGELFFQSCVPQPFPSGGTLTTAAGALDHVIQPQ